VFIDAIFSQIVYLVKYTLDGILLYTSTQPYRGHRHNPLLAKLAMERSGNRIPWPIIVRVMDAVCHILPAMPRMMRKMMKSG